MGNHQVGGVLCGDVYFTIVFNGGGMNMHDLLVLLLALSSFTLGLLVGALHHKKFLRGEQA
jgi:hypothetical protein